MTTFSIPEYTWQEFELLVKGLIETDFKDRNISLMGLAKSPAFNEDNIEEWIKWAYFLIDIPTLFAIRVDNFSVILISKNDVLVVTKESDKTNPSEAA